MTTLTTLESKRFIEIANADIGYEPLLPLRPRNKPQKNTSTIHNTIYPKTVLHQATFLLHSYPTRCTNTKLTFGAANQNKPYISNYAATICHSKYR
jgi:hypothetical protein